MITGEAGVEHVTSANAGALNAMEIGTGKYVFNLDNKFEYNLQSNNLIRIYKGQGIMNGRHFEMSPDQYQDLEISNGTQNEFRKDLVVIRYTKNLDTGIETGALVVIEGESVSQDPVDPEYNDGNILEGESVVDFPLYRINISGLNVTGVDKLFEVFAGYKAEIDSINTSLNQKVDSVYVNEDDGLIHVVKGGADTPLPFNAIKCGRYNFPKGTTYEINIGADYDYFISFCTDMSASAGSGNLINIYQKGATNQFIMALAGTNPYLKLGYITTKTNSYAWNVQLADNDNNILTMCRGSATPSTQLEEMTWVAFKFK